MTEAEKWLKNQTDETQGTDGAPTRQTPAVRCLRGNEARGAGAAADGPRPSAAAKVGLRVLAVVVFLLLFFVATYFAKVARPPIPALGFVVGALAFIVGGALWRLGGPSRRG